MKGVFSCLLQSRKRQLGLSSPLAVFVLILLVTAFMTFISSSDTFATTWHSISSAEFVRTYRTCPPSGCQAGVVGQNVGNKTIPYLVLQAYNTQYLFGVRAGYSVSSYNYKAYTTVYADLNLKAPFLGAGIADYAMTVLTSKGNSIEGKCSILETDTSDIYRLRCTAYLEGETPSHIYHRWGDNTYVPATTEHALALTNSNQGITVTYLGYGYDTEDSPEAALIGRTNELLGESIAEQQKTNDLLEQQAQQDQQDRDDMSNAVDNASGAGDSSQNSAQSTGTTLLAAFSSFVTALTSASAGDCSINMDLGNLDLGNVDLCQLSIPAPLQTISTILLIGFCVPLSIATAKKLIGLFRSFQT